MSLTISPIMLFPKAVKLFVIIQLFTFGSEAQPSVSLTVEGGVSLVGPHCPGPVRLFCEGVELTTLRWNYNRENYLIGSFYPDSNSPSSETPSNAAFVDLRLTKVINTTISQDFANFSSVLTVDLVQLQQQNISSIVCGDPGAMAVTPVGVQVLQPSIPRRPNVTTVTATYQSGILNQIKVTWGKSDFDCLEFEESVAYKLTLAGEQINETTCGEMFCEATINITEQRNDYTLSLTASNSEGQSETYFFPNTIEPQSDRYFSPKIAWNNCQAEVQCVSASLNHSDNPVCTVWYTTGPEQVNFSIRDNQLSSKFGTQFAFQGLTADTTYYFHFEVVVNSSLCIVETLNITTDSSSCDHQPQTRCVSSRLITAIVTVLVIAIFTLSIALLISWIYFKAELKRLKDQVSSTHRL